MSDIELKVILQIVLILIFLVIGIILNHTRSKKSNIYNLIIITVSYGAIFYAGIVWILRPLGVIIDDTILSEPKFALMIGLGLIYHAINSLLNIGKEKEEIK